MSIALFASVGNRDILFDGARVEPDAHREQGQKILADYESWRRRIELAGRASVEGQKILAEYESWRGRVRAPQITSCVEYVLEQHPRLGTILLFVTDQPASVTANHRNKDTVFAGQIVKNILLDRFGKRIDRVKFATIASGNPAAYDEMYDAVGRILGELNWRAEVEKCYVLPVGGTPAITAGLLLQACRFFEARCISLYLREGSRRPEPMDFARLIRRGLVRRMALERARANDFAAVESLLTSIEDKDVPAIAFAGFAHRRLDFNFDSARAVIEQAMPLLRAEDRALARRLGDGLDVFLEDKVESPEAKAKRTRALIAELGHNARITFSAARYVDFLARAIRFQEATLRFLIEQEFGVGTDERKDRARFLKFLQENEALDRYLRSQTVEGNSLDPARMTAPVFLHVLRYLAERGEAARPSALGLDGNDWANLATLLGRLNRLRDMRNRSIIAHDFTGVSRERLLGEYRGSDTPAADPVEDIAAIARIMARDAPEDVYGEIHGRLEALLEGD